MKCEHVSDDLCGVRRGEFCPYYDMEGCYYNPDSDKRKGHKYEPAASLAHILATGFYANRIDDETFLVGLLTAAFSAWGVEPNEVEAMLASRGMKVLTKKISEFDVSKLKVD